MISLDSPVWAKLRHAYGSADDVPGLLRQLRKATQPTTSYTDEPWYSLWSALCHQEDVYSASYASVPHIIQICLDSNGPIDTGFYLMPACVEVARARGRGPTITDDLREAYFSSLHKLHDCAHRHARDDWDSSMTQAVSAALAAAENQIDLAEVFVRLDDDVIKSILSTY